VSRFSLERFYPCFFDRAAFLATAFSVVPHFCCRSCGFVSSSVATAYKPPSVAVAIRFDLRHLRAGDC